MRQFEVYVENKVGKLAEVCEVVARSNVNIRAVATEAKDGKGVIKLITEDEDLTREVLTEARMDFKEFEIVPARVRDKPGELARVARALANIGVDIQSVFLLGKDRGTTEFAFKVSDLEKAREILR